MRSYIIKRTAVSIATLLAILLVLFLFLSYLPGSPFNDEKLTSQQKSLIMEKYGLDRPVPERFARYVANMLKGDFGLSYTISKNTPVSALVSARAGVSFRIGIQAVLLGSAVGLALGITAALNRGKAVDSVTTVIAVAGVSLPSYVFALLLSYNFAYKLGWVPMLYSTAHPFSSSILPSVSLSMFATATVARFTRTELLEVLGSDYLLLAESKGVRGAGLFVRHTLRNALIPIVTVIAPLIVNLMTGSMVVEIIFSVPGLGSLLKTAIQSNDYNVIVTLAFLYSALYIGAMFILDLLYGIIDPRIRVAGRTAGE